MAVACNKKTKTNQESLDDLLLRHRRRCRVLKKRLTRQKACNACVQAKAKCTYVQPCARCDGRGVPCTYAYQPSSPDAYQTSYQEVQDTYLEDTHHPEWVAGVDIGGDLPVLQPAQSLTRTPNFTNAGQPPNVQHPTQGVLGGIIPSHATGESFGLLEPVPTTDLVDLRSHGSNMQYSLPDMIHVLDQYPRQLLRDDFTPPCLHRTLYDEDVSDIATLARTLHGGLLRLCDGNRRGRTFRTTRNGSRAPATHRLVPHVQLHAPVGRSACHARV